MTARLRAAAQGETQGSQPQGQKLNPKATKAHHSKCLSKTTSYFWGKAGTNTSTLSSRPCCPQPSVSFPLTYVLHSCFSGRCLVSREARGGSRKRGNIVDFSVLAFLQCFPVHRSPYFYNKTGPSLGGSLCETFRRQWGGKEKVSHSPIKVKGFSSSQLLQVPLNLAGILHLQQLQN